MVRSKSAYKKGCNGTNEPKASHEAKKEKRPEKTRPGEQNQVFGVFGNRNPGGEEQSPKKGKVIQSRPFAAFDNFPAETNVTENEKALKRIKKLSDRTAK